MRFLLLALVLSACAKPDVDQFACQSGMPKENGKPSIMVMGDSISWAYLPHIQSGLPSYDVVHNPCSTYNSTITKERIDGWLSARISWEAITFNVGLWDVSSWAGVSDSDYHDNLVSIAKSIKVKTNHPLFILTTKVPPGADGRSDADVVRKNNIAIQVMAQEGIPVLDLYSVSDTLQAERNGPSDVHFNDTGSRALADAILASLKSNYGI